MAGSVYLLWLGITTLTSWKSAKFYPASPADDAEFEGTNDQRHSTRNASPGPLALLTKAPASENSRAQWRAPFFKGLLTSGVNPKALLLYLALIPQFISPDASWPLSVQTGALGLTHFAVSVAVYFAVALTARLLLRSRPLAARIVTACSGIIMIGLSLVLIYDQFFG
jgi:threonine/homoserine/homoserine lactone efflux protein